MVRPAGEEVGGAGGGRRWLVLFRYLICIILTTQSGRGKRGARLWNATEAKGAEDKDRWKLKAKTEKRGRQRGGGYLRPTN